MLNKSDFFVDSSQITYHFINNPVVKAFYRFKHWDIVPAYFLYSKISPGWHSNALQIASNVDSRIAFAFPFFNMEMLAIVMPTFSASLVTLIFRFANMTSMLMMMAMSLYRQVVFGLHVHGAL